MPQPAQWCISPPQPVQPSSVFCSPFPLSSSLLTLDSTSGLLTFIIIIIITTTIITTITTIFVAVDLLVLSCHSEAGPHPELENGCHLDLDIVCDWLPVSFQEASTPSLSLYPYMLNQPMFVERKSLITT